MIRKVIFFMSAVILLPVTHHIYASEIKVDSKITRVTVYPDSAVITRFTSVKLDAGDHQLIFSDIIPDVDENSLRISAQGPPEVKLFGAQVKKEFLEEVPSERIKQLKEEIKKLEDEKNKAEDAQTIITEEKQFLDSIRLYADIQVPKDLVTKMPQVSDLENLLKFLDAKLKDNFSLYSEYKFKIRDINEKADALKRQLDEISGLSKKLKRAIAVDLMTVKPATVDISVSYAVRGAAWQPIYEARASFDNQELELVSNGIIRQNTGEDWQDVEMSLSTARLAAGGNMPYVGPWFLRPYQPMERGRYDKFAAARAPAEAVSALEKEEPAADELFAPGKVVEPLYAQSAEKGVALEYKLAKKVSVKADGSDHKLPISAQKLSAQFEYSMYPRLLSSAYLGSRVANAPGLQLLAGRVNVFLEGDFTGTSHIASIGPSEEFDLYLGMDEFVKVKRELIEKKVDETLIGTIVSPAKRIVFKYKLTVENYKSKKIKVKLFEAMPVSEDDRIRVKLHQVSLEPKEKDWKDRKGIWLWELELESGHKREIVYSFTLEHPREMQIEGL